MSNNTNNNHNESICRIVEIYENERFQFSAMVWSSKGLLLTDRSPLSTRDGKYGWNNFEEANEQLISKGWSWSEAWTIDTSLPGTDGNGWGYATNFGSIEEGTSEVRELTHFVRRRKYTRTQMFVASSLGEQNPCTYCDTEKVNYISNNILEMFTKASLFENPGASISPVITNRLKTLLMDTLGLGAKSETMNLHDIEILIQKFLTIVINNKSVWSKAMSIFNDDVVIENIPSRYADLSNDLFTQREAIAIATMIIHKYDIDFTYHCNLVTLSTSEMIAAHQCPFSPFACPNNGCRVTMSRKHFELHDQICPFKMVECSRQCGDTVMRQKMESHLAMLCNLRPEECPYAKIGCLHRDIPHRDVPNHLQSNIQEHLMLAVMRIVEQQDVISNLNNKINQMNSKVTSHDQNILLLDTAVATSAVAIKSANRQAEESHIKAADIVERKVNKDIQTLSADVIRLKTAVSNVEKSVTNNEIKLEQISNRMMRSGEEIRAPIQSQDQVQVKLGK